MQNIDSQLNTLATRCFRNVADRDYIAARMCYRAGLITQFHWSSLQALEKYFKAIFLYNRIEAKKIGHDLIKAQELSKKLPFVLTLTDTTNKFLEHINCYGQDRYLERSYFIKDLKLLELDAAIWEIRRYCRVMNYDKILDDNTSKNMLDFEVKLNKDAEKLPYQHFHIVGGELESIIANKKHPAREQLIWKNLFYGSSRRKSLKNVPAHMYAENSPLFLNPDIYKHAEKYIFFTKSTKKAYK